jgi:hypothetical protein
MYCPRAESRASRRRAEERSLFIFGNAIMTLF